MVICIYYICRSLVCGRLICTYPSRAPFHQENAAVIYAFVRNVICVTINYKLAASAPDPLEIKNGSECETGRVNNLKAIFMTSSFSHCFNTLFVFESNLIIS